ncbi:MAG: alpha/beta fold hydrolase [Deltaproteobacteria bacterium]
MVSTSPFEPHYLDVDGGRMHYVDEGEGPVMLMLHGNPTWSFYYRNLVEAFRETHRVVVPDHIGCGLSDKPQDFGYRLEQHIGNVERLVDHLGIEKATVVVHDWGGAIGMGLAVRRPALPERFVVFNTAAFLADRIPFSIDICRIPGFGALMIRGLNAFAKAALMRCVVHKDRLTDDVKAGYLEPYDSWGNRVANLKFVHDIPMNPTHPTYPVLSKIGEGLEQFVEHPMMIAWGAQDFCFNDEFFAEWKRRFPKAETHYFEDAGHYVLEDAHERIVPLMQKFMEMPS